MKVRPSLCSLFLNQNAKDRALRDLEVRFETEMWETEAARMATLEDMQRDQEQGKSKMFSFLIQERDAADEAL